METFSQLIQVSVAVPYWAKSKCGFSQYYINTPITILDEPAFSHRGLLLDTARHFMPKNILKKVLDGMEASKLNILHWHIIDAQSFPIQSQQFPELSGVGAYSKFEIYTSQDAKEIVDYAHKRGIAVLPGISIFYLSNIRI